MRSLGLNSELAANGVEAVEKCAAGAYAAVLIDCQMPEMDGYEATRRIRALARPRVPIIGLAAGASSADRQLVLDSGMDDFLPKPVRRADLAAALARWLPGPPG